MPTLEIPADRRGEVENLGEIRTKWFEDQVVRTASIDWIRRVALRHGHFGPEKMADLFFEAGRMYELALHGGGADFYITAMRTKMTRIGLQPLDP